MKRIIVITLLLLCMRHIAFGEEFSINYNEETDQFFKITYSTLNDVPGCVEITDVDFFSPEYFFSTTVEVLEIPETVNFNGQYYTVTSINTHKAWGDSDYSGPKKIVFPSTIKWIKSSISSEILEEVVFNDSPIEEMHSNGFMRCNNLKSISFGDAYKAKTIGSFRSCASLQEIRIPDSVEEIPPMCFAECSSLRKVILPASIKKIERVVFRDCISLEEIEFEGDQNSECTYVDYGAFMNCESLKSLSLPLAKTIEENAFLNCSSLSSITINTLNQSNISIGAHAFDNCVNLRDFQYEPTSLRKIGEAAFNNCSSLQSFSLSSNCREIGSKAFAGCTGIEQFNVVGSNGFYSDIDGVLINRNGLLIAYPAGKKDLNYSVPEAVTSIASGAFEGAVHLTYIDMHDNVKELGVMAFRGCSALKEVKMTESLNHVPSGTFYGCSSLENVSIPDKCVYIGAASFQGCFSLVEVKVPSNLQVIGESAFVNCSKIESLVLPKNMKEIRANTFRNCESLKTITLPQNLDTIHFGALQGCKALKKIELPESLKGIEQWAFKGCESLESITIPDNVTGIGINAFEDCASLKEVKVGNGVKEIGQWAFYDCTALEKLTLGSSLETIGAEAFDGDINIREITCLSPEPPSFPGGFPEEVMAQATVTVPEGSEFAYNSNPVWDPMVEGEVQKAELIELNFTEVALLPKESITLVATVMPVDAVDKTVTWTSSDYYVAKVDENGVVRAAGYGSAVITATASNGVTATCRVTVTDPDGVDFVTIDSSSIMDVYTPYGILIKEGADKEFWDSLPQGIYILRMGAKVYKMKR